MENPKESWIEEKQSAVLYAILSQVETDERRKNLFINLGKAAEEQAGYWQKKVSAKEAQTWVYHPNFRARLVGFLIKIFGPQKIKMILAAMKVRGLSVYDHPHHTMDSHAMPTRVEEVGQRHRSASTAGNLRAAVFGVNDGLVSNASLILGIAGATMDHQTLLLAGIAGGLAGAFSMAAGEYISVRSQKEMVEYQIALEQDELEGYPEEEAAELALIYEARGLPPEQAQALAKKMIADPEVGLKVLAREELGIDPEDLSSPWGAGLFSFLSFGIGSLIPLFPFLFATTAKALPLTIGLTALALFGVGSAMSLFTGRNALWGGIRMVLIGGGAGVLSYLIGNVIGG